VQFPDPQTGGQEALPLRHEHAADHATAGRAEQPAETTRQVSLRKTTRRCFRGTIFPELYEFCADFPTFELTEKKEK